MRIPEEVAQNVLLFLVQEGMLVTNNCNCNYFFFKTTSDEIKNIGVVIRAPGADLSERERYLHLHLKSRKVFSMQLGRTEPEQAVSLHGYHPMTSSPLHLLNVLISKKSFGILGCGCFLSAHPKALKCLPLTNQKRCPLSLP